MDYVWQLISALFNTTQEYSATVYSLSMNRIKKNIYTRFNLLFRIKSRPQMLAHHTHSEWIGRGKREKEREREKKKDKKIYKANDNSLDHRIGLSMAIHSEFCLFISPSCSRLNWVYITRFCINSISFTFIICLIK